MSLIGRGLGLRFRPRMRLGLWLAVGAWPMYGVWGLRVQAPRGAGGVLWCWRAVVVPLRWWAVWPLVHGDFGLVCRRVTWGGTFRWGARERE